MLGSVLVLHMETIKFQLTPFSIEVDGYLVDVLEVLKRTRITGETWFFAVVRIRYKDILSRTFTIPVRSEKELINKLKIEITKIKFLEYAYGLEEVKKVIA